MYRSSERQAPPYDKRRGRRRPPYTLDSAQFLLHNGNRPTGTKLLSTPILNARIRWKRFEITKKTYCSKSKRT